MKLKGQKDLFQILSPTAIHLFMVMTVHAEVTTDMN
jgi:hypothetical protein